MPAIRFHLVAFVSLLVAGAALTDGAPAQVPAKHAVVGTQYQSQWPSPPGLFVFPLDGGQTTQGTPITGLPPELDSLSPGGQLGASGVSIRSSDGAILVTTTTDVGSAVAPGELKLFVLHLNDLAVTHYEEVVLGVATANASMNHAQLPDGRIFVTGSQGSAPGIPVSGGPMAGYHSAIVDLSGSTPTVSTLPNATFPPGHGYSGGVAIDPTGHFAYLLQTNSYYNVLNPEWSVVRQDLASGANCVIATSTIEAAHGIRCDDDGTVYVSASEAVVQNVSVNQHVHALTPDGCNPATITTATALSGWHGAWGMDLDRASGMLASVKIFPSPAPGRLELVDPLTGAAQVIGVAPPGGWSQVSNQGVAVSNAIDSYGPATDATNRHWFDNFPNPAGQPYVGNTGFALTMASAPGAAPLSAILLSFGRGSTVVLGAEFLVDPTTLVPAIVASGQSVPYPLPIPNLTGLAGVTLTAQSAHLEANNALATSRGLEFTIGLLPAPTISTISPHSPLANTTVTVAGTNFYNGMELRVAGNVTPIATRTATSLTFAMPSGVPCDSSITLTNMGGAASTAPINGTPVIYFMSSGGPIAGNALFYVTGLNLGGATLTINGAPLASITSHTNTGMVGYTPPGTLGPAAVIITSPTGCVTTGSYLYQ